MYSGPAAAPAAILKHIGCGGAARSSISLGDHCGLCFETMRGGAYWGKGNKNVPTCTVGKRWLKMLGSGAPEYKPPCSLVSRLGKTVAFV